MQVAETPKTLNSQLQHTALRRKYGNVCALIRDGSGPHSAGLLTYQLTQSQAMLTRYTITTWVHCFWGYFHCLLCCLHLWLCVVLQYWVFRRCCSSGLIIKLRSLNIAVIILPEFWTDALRWLSFVIFQRWTVSWTFCLLSRAWITLMDQRGLNRHEGFLILHVNQSDQWISL